MKQGSSPTRDDVARLVRGKRSQNRVGSRNMRHRLRLDELRRLDVARSRGFLVITSTTRGALRNAWHLDCQARGRPCVFVERSAAGLLLTGESNAQPIQERLADLAQVASFLESL